MKRIHNILATKYYINYYLPRIEYTTLLECKELSEFKNTLILYVESNKYTDNANDAMLELLLECFDYKYNN